MHEIHHYKSLYYQLIWNLLFSFLKIRKEFSSDVDSAKAAFRMLSATSSSGHADLTTLFRIAAHEAKKSRAQKRILRVVSSG